MSKICPNCQTEYDDSHDFCDCGSRLIDDIVANDPILNVGDATAIMGGGKRKPVKKCNVA